MGFTVAILIGSLIFTVVVIFFVFRMVSSGMGDKKTLESGVPGTATVMSIAPGNMVVNNIYYQCSIGLRVTLPAQASYDVMISQLVPITAMAAVSPGNTVGVKVDPTDNTKVVIDWSAGVVPQQQMQMVNMDPTAGEVAAVVAGAAAAGGMGQSGIQVTSTRDLLKSGQRVLGVVSEFADSGTTSRSLGLVPSQPEFIDDPMYAITLQLHIANTNPIEAKVVHRVPRAMVPQLHLGLQLNCAVDPSNPSRAVAIDWGDISL